MSEQTKTGTKDAYQAEFEALPLDEKFSRLFRLEAATLNETMKYVGDTSVKAFEKISEVVNDLTQKFESEIKNGACAEPAAAGSASSKSTGTKPPRKPKKD